MVRLTERMQGLIIGVIIIAVVGVGAALWFSQAYTTLPCGGPCPGKEAFALQSYLINTPTNMSLTILNVGVMGSSFTSSAARSTGSQAYSNNTLTTPFFGPNTQETVNIVIDGAAFTFQHGNSYTIILASIRNNQFYFTINT